MRSVLKMASTIYLIRHGIPENHLAVLGQSDPALTSEGQEQARSLAATLAGQGIERVLSSSLQRAQQTAAILADHLDLELDQDPRLNEISYGSWDGLLWEEIEKQDPETAKRKLENWWEVTPRGGEDFMDFYRRVRGAWIDLRAGDRTTAVVAHLGVNSVLAELAGTKNPKQDLDWNFIRSFHQDYAGCIRLEL